MHKNSMEELCRRAIDAVEKTGIMYLVYGGVALPAWGDVITTQDLDLVVQVDKKQASQLISNLREAGFFIPQEAEKHFFVDTWIRAALGNRDVDIALGRSEFDKKALSRAVTVTLYGREVRIASPEDLILYKLVAYSRKDLAHVEDIMIRQGSKLDVKYLKDWSQRIADSTGKYEIPGALQKMLDEHGIKE